MKRRNANDGKRRPVKRTKISDNFFGSTLVYAKLLLLWVLVLAADYLLEFRFEYLWPFWLLVRSIYDSFKYQGLAFSVFFICIALTSDMICFLFIPVHWLFFAASTYVWVQYVWHTEKGICLPTVFLWLLFVYIEAAIRLKEYKFHFDTKNLPFHLDLCRPFAAHCIGYPVVTLGFGFKSYVGYRMKQRRQKEIQKENETYYSLLREALPPGPARDDAFNPQPSPKPGMEERISAKDGAPGSGQPGLPLPIANGGPGDNLVDKCNRSPDKQIPARPDSSPDLARCNGSGSKHLNSSSLSNGSPGDSEYLEHRRNAGNGSATALTNGEASDDFNESGLAENNKINRSNSKSVGGGRDASRKGRDGDKKGDKDSGKDPLSLTIKLESDVKRLKCDLQLSRNRENDLRDQIVSYMSSERGLKSEVSSLLVEKSQLEARINSLISARAGEKQTRDQLEKKLAEEKKQRSDFQVKLETERKNKKDAVKAELKSAQESKDNAIVSKLEVEINKLRDELARTEQRANNAEEEIMGLRKNVDNDKLMMQLKKAKEKEDKLGNTLRDETKIKMDLFSALGVAKRDLQIREHMLCEKDREILDLKGTITEFLAVGSSNSLNNFMSSMGVNNTGPVSAPMSAAPGDFPTRTTSASSGLFTPYNHHDHRADNGDLGVLDLVPAGTELSRLAGLGLDSLDTGAAVTSSFFASTPTYSTTNGSHEA